MPTARTLSFQYAFAPDQVASIVRDPEHLRARCEAAGETNVEVLVRPDGDVTRVTVSRDKEIQLPAFAKKLFNPVNRIVDDTRWRREGDRWVGDYTIEITGTPSSIKGRSELIPSPDGCRLESSFEVTARVPLVGANLERFVADIIERGLTAGARKNADRLAAV